MTQYQWCQPTRGQWTLYRVVRGDRHDTQILVWHNGSIADRIALSQAAEEIRKRRAG